jgi:ribosome-binding protein aMBF1 (putative translation factor)
MAATATKMARSKKVPKVGRKRQPIPKELLKTPSGKFAVRLSSLMEAAGLDAKELGAKIGKSSDTVHVYLAARAVPHLDDWPRIAKALGLSDYRDLLSE